MRVDGYARPDTLEELLATMAEAGPEARVVAGGTDLWVNARAGRRWPLLVNITRVPELKGIALGDGFLELGALTTVAQVLKSPEVLRTAPLLWHACDRFASPLVRSRATLAGNLCNASPAADASLALLALDAQVDVASTSGRRALSVEQLVLGPGKTALAPQEVVTRLRIPVPARKRYQRFEKSGLRPALEISIVALAANLDLDDGGVVRDARLCFGAVAPVPLRGRQTEAAIVGRPLSVDSVEAAARIAAAEVKPIDDVRATAAYRRRLAAAYVRRALSGAMDSRRLDAVGS
jgi:xanthine dehydrogenase FAD-binding subunit